MVTPSKPLPPYEQLLPSPTPYFKMFLERSLNDPPPPTTPLQAPFTATPSPSITPSPPSKNFDHTLICFPVGKFYFFDVFYTFLAFFSSNLGSSFSKKRFDSLNPIAYGIFSFFQLRGGGGLFGPHPRKHS